MTNTPPQTDPIEEFRTGISEIKKGVESHNKDVADLKSALQGEDKDLIKQKVDAMAQASMKLGEALYQSSQGAAASSGGGPSEGGDGKENVVDVDFEEVKDDDSKKSA